MKGFSLISNLTDFSALAINKQMYVLQSIAIQKNPNKITYELNSPFNTEGMVVIGNYLNANGDTKIEAITDYSHNAPDLFTTIGNTTIIISYEGFQTSLTVAVAESQIVDITNEFVWVNNSAVLPNNGNLNTGTRIMKTNEFVNISDAVSVNLTFMKWTSSAGVASGYGLAIYDSAENYIMGIPMEVADASLGNSNGNSYDLYVELPTNAYYIKTTYHQDEEKYGAFKASKTILIN